jgi:hypothetical protein
MLFNSSPDVAVSTPERAADDIQMSTEMATSAAHIQSLIARQDEACAKLESLEEAARVAIDTITVNAEHRLAQSVENSEARLVESLGIVEQHQREINRWQGELDQQLRTRLRELQEWEELLREKRDDIHGLREMAEASISLASGELDTRWEKQRRELQEILATFESDERARWDAFVVTAIADLTVSSDGDPVVIDHLRTKIQTIQTSFDQFLHEAQNNQQVQREQMAAVRSEMRSLIESEHNAILSQIERNFAQKVEEIQNWQQKVHAEHVHMSSTMESAIAQQHSIVNQEMTDLRRTFDELMKQVCTLTSTETGQIRLEQNMALHRLKSRTSKWNILTFIVAIIALLTGVGSFLIGYLHF